MKKFGDLKEGDIIWIIDGWRIKDVKAKRVRNYYKRFYIYTSHRKFCGYSGSRRSGYMFVNEEDAFKQLGKMLKIKIWKLEKEINRLVSEFDFLDSISPPTVFSSTRILSMKDLKPGDSVWEVDKVNRKIREVMIVRIESKKLDWYSYRYSPLYINTSSLSFYAYPNSRSSVNHLYYTDEKEAWGYMLKWKKSRMKTVGKEMEKLIKELEKYEEVL